MGNSEGFRYLCKNRFKLSVKEVQKGYFLADEVINKILMTIIGSGHILIDDIPGVGKTTMANAFAAKAMGLKQKRVQFTPDVYAI